MENSSLNHPKSGGSVPTDHIAMVTSVLYLLHVSQHILPAVEHAPPFFRVQLVDEICGVVVVAVLVPADTQ